MVVFFVTANILGRWRKARKEKLGFEKGGERDWAQVLANSGVAVSVLVLTYTLTRFHITFESSHDYYVCFAAAIAEANADTWATEIGAALNVRPRLITTFAKTSAGRSGAVSVPGTCAAFAGATLISASTLPFMHSSRFFIIIAISGLVGTFADSIFGATIQAAYVLPDGTRSVNAKTDGERLPCSGISCGKQ